MSPIRRPATILPLLIVLVFQTRFTAAAPVPGDEHYDPAAQMLLTRWHSPGYHTRVPNGAMVHETRGSMQYALDLLQSGDSSRYPRAAEVIRRVLSLQDVDPSSKTCGVWPWLLEEPLGQMAAPDRNWADFLGVLEAQILIDHSPKLPADLIAALRSSLTAACRAIIQRDVGIDYSNIAAMDCATTTAAGEALNVTAFFDYGSRKIHQLVEHTVFNGGFTEYNSPTYTIVLLHEMERTEHLVKDPKVRADAEKLRRIAWKTIVDHYHPGTAQWAGPHARAYSDKLGEGTLQYLADETGLSLGGVAPTGRRQSGDWHLPCPPEFVDRFRELPGDKPEAIVESTFSRTSSGVAKLVGTTWLSKEACLGTIDRDNLWTQRRPLIAYWRTPQDPSVVLRLRFLHDNRDFASAEVANAQQASRVLSAIRLVPGLGDFHPSLDKPPGGRFEASELRVRYELSGRGVKADSLGGGRYVLSAGDWRGIVLVAAGCQDVDGRPMQWTVTTEPDHVCVDGIYYQGKARDFTIPVPTAVFFGAALELSPLRDTPANICPEITSPHAARWALGPELRVTMP